MMREPSAQVCSSLQHALHTASSEVRHQTLIRIALLKDCCAFVLEVIPPSQRVPIGAAMRTRVSAMTSVRPEDGARFMGFRACPACGETLFAAERAAFTCAGDIVLRWRCDTCDHAFETYAEAPRGPSARAA